MKSPNDLIEKLTGMILELLKHTYRNWYEKTSYEEEVPYSF